MTTVELRYLMPGATAAQVHTAGLGLAAELTALATEIECVHAPAVETVADACALFVRVGICPDKRGASLLTLARMAVLAAAQRASVILKEVPGAHRLVDADEHADAA